MTRLWKRNPNKLTSGISSLTCQQLWQRTIKLKMGGTKKIHRQKVCDIVVTGFNDTKCTVAG